MRVTVEQQTRVAVAVVAVGAAAAGSRQQAAGCRISSRGELEAEEEECDDDIGDEALLILPALTVPGLLLLLPLLLWPLPPHQLRIFCQSPLATAAVATLIVVGTSVATPAAAAVVVVVFVTSACCRWAGALHPARAQSSI